MEKIMIATVIAVIGLWVSGKPWVTPNETGPVQKPPAIDKPAYTWEPQEPSKDLTKAEPNVFQY